MKVYVRRLEFLFQHTKHEFQGNDADWIMMALFGIEKTHPVAHKMWMENLSKDIQGISKQSLLESFVA